MNNQTNNEQQTVTAKQALVMGVNRVKAAEVELESAKINLYSVSEQVTVQMVQADNKAMKDKIAELESAPKLKTGKEPFKQIEKSAK